jgi:hypothetical protein
MRSYHIQTSLQIGPWQRLRRLSHKKVAADMTGESRAAVSYFNVAAVPVSFSGSPHQFRDHGRLEEHDMRNRLVVPASSG